MNEAHFQDNKEPGLLNNGEPVFLVIAKIFKPHGVKGEVSVEMLPDFAEHVSKGTSVYIEKNRIPSRINTIRKADKKYLISFLDHPSIENLEKFRNNLIYIQEKELPKLSDEEYYIHDLIGMEVLSVDNKSIGVLTDILFTGANDVYIIQPHDKGEDEILIPAIKQVVVNVDIKDKKMIVKLQEWR